jgi:hypothetical protein
MYQFKHDSWFNTQKRINQIMDLLKMNRMYSAEQSFPPQLEHYHAEWSTFDCMSLDGIHHGECPANGELGKHHMVNEYS